MQRSVKKNKQKVPASNYHAITKEFETVNFNNIHTPPNKRDWTFLALRGSVRPKH